jgi:hypothetical protein
VSRVGPARWRAERRQLPILVVNASPEVQLILLPTGLEESFVGPLNLPQYVRVGFIEAEYARAGHNSKRCISINLASAPFAPQGDFDDEVHGPDANY